MVFQNSTCRGRELAEDLEGNCPTWKELDPMRPVGESVADMDEPMRPNRCGDMDFDARNQQSAVNPSRPQTDDAPGDGHADTDCNQTDPDSEADEVGTKFQWSKAFLDRIKRVLQEADDVDDLHYSLHQYDSQTFPKYADELAEVLVALKRDTITTQRKYLQDQRKRLTKFLLGATRIFGEAIPY